MEFSQRERLIVILSFLFLIVVAIFASDVYLPSLPAMAEDLIVTKAQAKLTITLYLAGLGVAPLFLGPLSDRFGRKPLTLCGLGLASVGSIVCMMSPTMKWVIIGRLIQGIGYSSCMTLGRAMASDIFEGQELAKIGSYIGMSIGIVPAIAPTVGGYIQEWLGWRANFGFLLMTTLIAITLGLAWLPETHGRVHRKSKLRLKTIADDYATLISKVSFIVFPIVSGFAFAGCMSYLSLSPFLFQDLLGLSPIEFGWLAFVVGAGIFFGSWLNAWLMQYYLPQLLHICGAIFMFLAALLMWVFGAFGILNIPAIMIPMFFFMTGVQFIFANSFSLGMAHARGRGGVASALFASVQIGLAALASGYAAHIHLYNQIPLSLLLIILSAASLCLALWEKMYSKRRR